MCRLRSWLFLRCETLQRTKKKPVYPICGSMWVSLFSDCRLCARIRFQTLSKIAPSMMPDSRFKEKQIIVLSVRLWTHTMCRVPRCINSLKSTYPGTQQANAAKQVQHINHCLSVFYLAPRKSLLLKNGIVQWWTPDSRRVQKEVETLGSRDIWRLSRSIESRVKSNQSVSAKRKQIQPNSSGGATVAAQPLWAGSSWQIATLWGGQIARS